MAQRELESVSGRLAVWEFLEGRMVKGERGFVSLVGAGPGDPFLLTLAGREALLAADCVVYDRLVHPRILDWSPPSAERIFVGKEAGNRYMPQDEINQLLVDLAKQGRRVVRLKGGDPFIFARGAEEIDALAEASVAYEIIPGVTAALGAAATAAIPLTHRRFSSMVTIVTGHEDPEKPASVDWNALARQGGTLVLYMARKKMPEIVQHLLDGGMATSTPIAFIQWGGSNRQRTHITTLAEGAAGVPESIGTPMLAIVGPVVAERQLNAWIERRPLFGQRVLLLRPKDQAMESARRLERLGADVLCQPGVEILPPKDWAPMDEAIASMSAGDWLVFTSANGVESFLDRLLSSGADLRRLGGVQIAAIGPTTSDALCKRGLRADVVPGEFSSEALADNLLSRVKDARVYLLRADRGREVLQETLPATAREVVPVCVYRQVDVERPSAVVLEAIGSRELDWVFFTSGNIARSFFAWLNESQARAIRDHVRLASISPITSAVIREAGFEVHAEGSSYNMEGMVRAVVQTTKSRQFTVDS